MKLEDKVRVRPSPDMQIVQIKFDENTGAKRLLCAWSDGENDHHRWFSEEELEAVEAEPEPEKAE